MRSMQGIFPCMPEANPDSEIGITPTTWPVGNRTAPGKSCRGLEIGDVPLVNEFLVIANMPQGAWPHRAHIKRMIAQGCVFIAQASVSKLPFKDGKFDVDTAVETQYYWPDLKNDKGEILRVLKPGGRLMIVAESYKGSAERLAAGAGDETAWVVAAERGNRGHPWFIKA
jgi:SAM-dependent methyltransferase